MKYRAEIDGLRALAIIPVILFHYGFGLISGGFIGVDVFFVISGYLITTIILNELEDGNFNLFSFYERRARRILPALLLILIVTYSFSWYTNLPGPHKIIGQYVVSSILFSSNILLFLKGNEYFGIENNPLFHTWSLGVEEQYYLVFPLFMLFFWRFGKRTIMCILVIAFIVSLLIAHWGTYNNPIASFYLLPMRGWEILLGVFCAFYLKNTSSLRTHNLINQALGMLGLALILSSMFLFDTATPTPGLYSLMPTIGTGLFIIFACKGTMAARLLSGKPQVGIGLISYSLYLWHLPVFVIINQIFPKYTSYFQVFMGLPIVFLLSYLSWRFIEKPFRVNEIISRTRFLFITGSFIFLMLCFGVIGHINGGFVDRNEIFNKLSINNGFGLQCNGNTELTIECMSSKFPKVAVLGNSFSMQFVDSLSSHYKDGVVQLTLDSCKVGYLDSYEDINAMSCKDFYYAAVKTINKNDAIELVFISSPFDEVLDKNFRKSLIKLLNDLSRKSIIILGPTPSSTSNVGECFAEKYLNPFKNNTLVNCDFIVNDSQNKKVRQLAEISYKLKHVDFIDITPFICQNDTCLMEPETGKLMYFDRYHLSRGGAKEVIRKVKNNNLLPSIN